MGVYIKWWIFGPLIAIIFLSTVRNNLFDNNLLDTNVTYPAGPECTGRALTARSIDGSCNDLEKSAMGMAGMRVGRNVPIANTFVDEENLLNPNPRDISRALLTRDEIKEVPFLNYLATAWIQFMIHDWFSHGENQTEAPYEVLLNDDDTLAGDRMLVNRTMDDPTQPNDSPNPKTFQNVVTAWWDGSQLYGSDQETNDKVRSFVDGKLKVDENNYLPINPETGTDQTGHDDNWWVGLSMFHTLFTREHNAIADMLKSKYPQWNDEEIYDHARLINSAIMAKIHTLDWTPAILKNNVARISMKGNWQGILPWLPHTGNPIISGFMGGHQEHYSAPFSLTEEFTSVYRMHPLLRDDVEILDHSTGSAKTTISLEDSAFEGATTTMQNHGLTDLFYSFGHTHPGLLLLNNMPKFLTALETEHHPQPVDMGAIDIIRDRERGVPRYNEFRKLINLKPIKKFSDLTPNKELAQRISDVYGGDVDKLDLMIGSLGEEYRPPGFGFGETAFNIFVAMASRRLSSDRFFTDSYKPSVYTKEGMRWIKDASIGTVILRHMPELSETLKEVGNPFFPWDEPSKW